MSCTCGLPLRCLILCSLPRIEHKLTRSQPKPSNPIPNPKSFSNRLNRLVRSNKSNKATTIKPYTPATASSPISKPVGARPAGPLPVPVMEVILLSYSLHATSWSTTPSTAPPPSSAETSASAKSVVSSDALTNWLNARWRKTGYQVSPAEVYAVLKANGVNAEMARGDRLDGAFHRGTEGWECL